MRPHPTLEDHDLDKLECILPTAFLAKWVYNILKDFLLFLPMKKITTIMVLTDPLDHDLNKLVNTLSKGASIQVSAILTN